MRFGMTQQEFAEQLAKAEAAQQASNDNQHECDCPEGFCAADEAAMFDSDEDEFDAVLETMAGIMGAAMADAEMAEQMEIAERREAVAQLGRIIEGLTILTAIHADLVKATVED
jgi:hypothetical protein